MRSLVMLSIGLGLAATAGATVLIPGSMGVPIGSTTVAGLSLNGAAPVNQSVEFFQTGTGHNVISGDLISAVYTTTGGTEDFFYQIVQDPTNPPTQNVKSIQGLFAPIGGSFTTNAFFVSSGTLTSSPFSAPTTNKKGVQAGTQGLTASRNTSGVQFFLNPLGTSKTSSTVSAVFVIATSGTSFQSDVAGLQDANISTTAATFSPTPEPSFYGALMVGLIGLGWVGRRAKKLF